MIQIQFECRVRTLLSPPPLPSGYLELRRQIGVISGGHPTPAVGVQLRARKCHFCFVVIPLPSFKMHRVNRFHVLKVRDSV